MWDPRISRRTALVSAGASAAALTAIGSNAQAAPRSPSGSFMPRGNLPGWKQVIAEDFTTSLPIGSFVPNRARYGLLDPTCRAYPAYGHRLGFYGYGPINTYGYYDAGRTVSTSNSLLDIYMHYDAATRRNVCAAVFPFRPGTTSNARTYGRWSYRMRSYQATGTNWGSCSLLWPDIDAEWPQSGEIDWPEGDVRAVRPGQPGGIEGWFHIKGGNYGSDRQVHIPGLNGMWTNWHTFTIEWLPNSLKCYMNEHLVLSRTQNVPTTRMRWNTQTQPAFDHQARALKPSGSAHLQIDWVTAYDPI